MADPLPYPDSQINTSDENTPRWVKIFGVIIILLLLFVIWHLVGGGHGPGQHMPSGDHAATPEHLMHQS